MKIPICGTGLSGLVGSRVTELLQDKYSFNDLSLTTGVDITDYESLEKKIKEDPSEIIIHMAAKTDVDACEDDKILGEEGTAWVVNVDATRNIVECAQNYGKKIIYISTDFVFDGTRDFYTEEDLPNPVNWYGVTKFEGERIITESNVSYVILRLAYPYRASYEKKQDFLRRIVDVSKKYQNITALSDHIFTPTFIDDLAWVIDFFIQKNLSGIYHAVGSESLSPLHAAEKILSALNINAQIKPILRKDYFKDRAFRPFKLALKNDKISRLGLKMLGFSQGLVKIKDFL